MRVLNFSDEAKRLIVDYVKDVETRIRELGFTIESRYLETRMFDLENYIKFFSVKRARKRGAGEVEAVDVKRVLKKFGKPQEFVSSRFKDADTWARAQRITLERLKVIREKLEEAEEARVLDAGCGWGRFLTRLSPHHAKGIEMIGVDLDAFSLQYGKTVNETAMFLKSDVQALPFRDEVFDVIVCMGVIHEVKRGRGRRRVLEEFSRVSKPGGLLCIADAFARFQIVSLLTRIHYRILSLGLSGSSRRMSLKRCLERTGSRLPAWRKSAHPP